MGWLRKFFSSSPDKDMTVEERISAARSELGCRADEHAALPPEDRRRNLRDIATIADLHPELAVDVIGALRMAKDDPVDEVRTGAIISLGFLAERHDAVRKDILLALGHIGTASYSVARDHAINQAARISVLRPDYTDTAVRVIRTVGFGTMADEGNRMKALNLMGNILARPSGQRPALIAETLPHFVSASTDRHDDVRKLADEWIGRLNALKTPKPPDPAP